MISPLRFVSHGNRQSGFTLLEILVAVTILALVFTSVSRLFGGTLRSVENSVKYAHAAVLGEQMLTAVLFDETEFPPPQSAGRFEENPDFSYSLETSLYEEPIGVMEVSAFDADSQLSTYRVVLTVEWQEGAKTRSVKLNTLKTVVEGEQP